MCRFRFTVPTFSPRHATRIPTRFLARFVLAIIAGTVVPGDAGENWPQFRGPHANGQSTAKDLPVTFSESQNIRWKTPVPGKAWSSPVVWDQQVWVSTASKDGKQLGALCVDALSGRILHDVTVFRIAEPQYCHPMNSYGTPTPFIEQGRVYLHFGTHGTACLDTTTAKTLWARQDFPCNHFRGPASSPVITENLLVLTFDGVDTQYLVALDKTTGKTVWKRDRNIQFDTDDTDYHKAYSTPALVTVNGKPQLVSPSAGATIAYVPRTGEEIWRVRSGGMNAAALPLFGNGLIYATSAAGGFQLFAVRPDGHGDVTDTHVAWKFSKHVPTRSSQILLDDRLFMISDNGMASCLDAKTGHALWQERIEGAFSASPLFAAGRIYFFGEEGEIPVIEAADKFKLLATNRLDDGFMASPAVHDNALILRSRTHLYRVENPSPTPATQSSTPAANTPTPLFDGSSLAGWEGNAKTWRVRDGTIVGGSLNGNPQNEFLATTKEFRNFIVRLEYRLTGTEGFVNGGVQLRSVRTKQPPNEMCGYQADIGNGYSGCLYDESRRNKVLARPADEVIRGLEKPGDWNRYEVHCIGPRIRLVLNGTTTVDYTEPDTKIPQQGLLALQIHGGNKAEISFRNLTIEELP